MTVVHINILWSKRNNYFILWLIKQCLQFISMPFLYRMLIDSCINQCNSLSITRSNDVFERLGVTKAQWERTWNHRENNSLPNASNGVLAKRGDFMPFLVPGGTYVECSQHHRNCKKDGLKSEVFAGADSSQWCMDEWNLLDDWSR